MPKLQRGEGVACDVNVSVASLDVVWEGIEESGVRSVSMPTLSHPNPPHR